MKKLIGIALTCIVTLAILGCPQPNDSGNNGGGKVYIKPADVTTTTLIDDKDSNNIKDYNMTLKGIQGGEYLYQGALGGNASLQEDVTVESFYLAETEVTQAQWFAVMGTSPSYFSTNVNLPVEVVDWYDAITFCNKLSLQEGLSDYYNADGSIKGGAGYRLPTEREWEYAAGWEENGERNSHAGVNIVTDADYDGIDDEDATKDLKEYAWYNENNGSSIGPSIDEDYGTKIVGTAGSTTLDESKSGNANALGLYDMSGNVWEMCYDWYTEGLTCVIRGGGWDDSVSHLSVTFRTGIYLSIRSGDIGFRVARSVAP